MSLAQLQAEVAHAAEPLDLTLAERELLAHRTELVTHELGVYAVDGGEVLARRVHSGHNPLPGMAHGPVARGGIRGGDDPNYVDTNGMLAYDMTLKLAARGHTTPDQEHDGIYFHGGKGFMVGDFLSLSQRGMVGDAMAQYAERMHSQGLARHDVDGIATDMFTNGYSDHYANTVNRLNDGQYAEWRATASGKSVQNGGRAFRPAATGVGVYDAHKAMLEGYGEDSVHTVAAQGLGQVGGYYLLEATRDSQLAVQYVSDMDGTIWTPHGTGFEIDEAMVENISNNPAAAGRRAELFYQALREKYNDKLDLRFSNNPDAIYEAEVDDFMAGAGKYTITGNRAPAMKVRYAYIEGANDPLDTPALQYCEANGIKVGTGAIFNGAGADESVEEIKMNIEQAHAKPGETVPVPGYDQARMASRDRTRRLVGDVIALQRNVPELTTFRMASLALSVQNLVRYNRAA